MFETFKSDKRRVYLGCTIEKAFPSGYWMALTCDGTKVAETLQLLKELIREAERPKKKAETRISRAKSRPKESRQ